MKKMNSGENKPGKKINLSPVGVNAAEQEDGTIRHSTTNECINELIIERRHGCLVSY